MLSLRIRITFCGWALQKHCGWSLRGYSRKSHGKEIRQFTFLAQKQFLDVIVVLGQKSASQEVSSHG